MRRIIALLLGYKSVKELAKCSSDLLVLVIRNQCESSSLQAGQGPNDQKRELELSHTVDRLILAHTVQCN